MKEVSRLTRSGDPNAATALIQSTLAGASAYKAPHSGAHAHRDTTRAEAPAQPASRSRIRILNPEVQPATRSPVRDSNSEVSATDSTRTASIDPDDLSDDREEGLSSRDSGSRTRPQTAPADAFVDGLYKSVDGQLHYKLYKPALATGRTAPLLVMLHGCTQDAGDFAAGTAMNAIARESGLYVLYPTQSANANMNRCWNWFERAHQHRGSGEPALLGGLTRQIIEDHSIDSGQVFIAGLSAGGAMALIMAEQYPELFAAVGVHSGLPTGVASSMSEAFGAMQGQAGHGIGSSGGRMPGNRFSANQSARSPFKGFSPADGQINAASTTVTPPDHGSPLPTIVFHGDRDRTVNPANAERIVGDWLTRNGNAEHGAGWQANTKSATMATGRRYSVTTYTRDDGSRAVGCEYWNLAGSAHCWSGGDPSGSYTDANGPDASAEMVRFFLEHGSR